MGRFRLPSVGTLEGRVRGDRDRALLTALLRADALSIGWVSSFPGCSATRPRLTRSLVHSATRKRKMSWTGNSTNLCAPATSDKGRWVPELLTA